MQVQITETNYGLVRSSCFVVISFMFQQPICNLFFSVFNAWKVVCKFKTCRIRSNNLQHENSGAILFNIIKIITTILQFLFSPYIYSPHDQNQNVR
jgi:hypothetical protein